jgi:cupin 2 domain-containing protein
VKESLAGRLRSPVDAPVAGEQTEQVARIGGVIIEQILSGTLQAPVEYKQDHDEWVVVLAGGAVVQVGADRVKMSTGDWLLLPAGKPHRLLETEQGTSWLALRAKA